MRPRLAKLLRHPRRASTAFVLLTAAPKCVVCVSAYIGLGAFLGFGGPELCGGPTDPPVAWTTVLAWCGFILALTAAAGSTLCRRAWSSRRKTPIRSNERIA